MEDAAGSKVRLASFHSPAPLGSRNYPATAGGQVQGDWGERKGEQSKQKSGKGLTLQTQSFTVKECVFIVRILIHKFGLKCSIHMQRNQPTIYISAKSVRQIKAKLLPYFASSMVYKLGL